MRHLTHLTNYLADAAPAAIVRTWQNLVAAFPPRVELRIGEDVEIGVDVEHAHFFDEETGAALR